MVEETQPADPAGPVEEEQEEAVDEQQVEGPSAEEWKAQKLDAESHIDAFMKQVGYNPPDRTDEAEVSKPLAVRRYQRTIGDGRTNRRGQSAPECVLVGNTHGCLDIETLTYSSLGPAGHEHDAEVHTVSHENAEHESAC